MKIIHTGDFHIGATLSHAAFSNTTKHSRRVKEIEESVYDLLNKIDTSVDALLITGDLFDHHQVALNKVDRLFVTLSKLPCDVFIVIGNHDTFLHNKTYQYVRQFKNIHFFDKADQLVSLKTCDVYGFSTENFDETKLGALNKNLDKTKKNILCLHGDVLNKDDAHYLTSLKTLQSLDFDYIAIGHIHKMMKLDNHIFYAGNIEPLDFSELGDKGYMEVTLSDTLNTRFVKHAKRQYYVESINVDNITAFNDLVEAVEACIKGNDTDYFRIKLTGVKSPELTLDDSDIAHLQEPYKNLEIKNDTTSPIDIDQLKKTYQDTIIEKIITAYESTSDNRDSLNLALEALLDTKEGE